MKKLLVLVGALVIPGCFETSTRPSGGVAPAAVQTPAEVEVKSDVTHVVQPSTNAEKNSEDVLSTSEVTSGEFGSAIAKAHPDEAKAMLAAAQKTWEATNASYDVGTQILANVHHWSRQLMLAERALAENTEQDLAALVDYWKRNKQIYLKIRALYYAGSRGGEAENFYAASYYLAEAELLLKAAGGTVPEDLD
jgi:hypothetical protein